MINNTGKVTKLFISTGDELMPRKECASIIIDENGIIGDKFYAKNINRSILVSSTESYQLASNNNIEIEDGVLGENILLDINLCHLLPGNKIQIGETILEVTQNCTICKGLSQINSKLPKLLKDDRGIFFRTIKGGEIKSGDSVTII